MSRTTSSPDPPEHPATTAEELQPDQIAEAYRRAYADGEGLGEELEGWEHEGCDEDLEP